MDFIEPDGTLARRCQGFAPWSGPTRVQGAFTQAGEGWVEACCIVLEGSTLSLREKIRILPAARAPSVDGEVQDGPDVAVEESQ
jgi:hypothetical protein